MADARSLLRAAKAGASTPSRVDDPWASTSAAGVLRCTACEQALRHAALWPAHAASKPHRSNVARALEQREGQSAPPADEEPVATAEEEGARSTEASAPPPGTKRKSSHASPAPGTGSEVATPHAKRARTGSVGTRGEPSPPVPSPGPDFSAELAAFEREVLASAPQGQSEGEGGDYYASTAGATIEMAPQLVGEEPVPGSAEPEEERQEQAEARAAAERVRGERLEIYERDEEEMRVQAEGRQRVQALRDRLAAIKKRRA